MYITNDNCSVFGISGKTGILFILFLLAFPLHSQIKMEEYPLKTLIISRFFEFVKWPPKPGNSRAPDEIVMGIIGETPIREHKRGLYEKIRVPGKKLIIKELSRLDDIKDCHAILIGGSESKRLDEILAVTRNKPILSIGDTEGFGKRGVLINLYKSGKNVKFEINITAVQKTGLNFRSKLYKLARIIR